MGKAVNLVKAIREIMALADEVANRYVVNKHRGLWLNRKEHNADLQVIYSMALTCSYADDLPEAGSASSTLNVEAFITAN